MLIPKYVLEGLDDLSVENLRLGRITKEAMTFAFKRASGHPYFSFMNLHYGTASTSNRILADELNDLIEAAKMLDKTNA